MKLSKFLLSAFFVAFVLAPGIVSASSPVTKADYEETIAQKEEELQAVKEEKDALVKETGDDEILKSSWYTKCFADVPVYNPELMPKREQICKESAYGSQCQTERCADAINANDFAEVSACASGCVADVKAGKYPASKHIDTKGDLESLDFKIQNLERDIAELNSNMLNLSSTNSPVSGKSPISKTVAVTGAVLATCAAAGFFIRMRAG